MSVLEAKAIELVDTLYDYLIDVNDIRLATFLAHWPSEPYKTRTVSPNTLPVLSYLPELVTEEDTAIAKITKMLATSMDSLGWGQTYSKRDFGAAFLEKYGWTELIGLRGPIISEGIACGFLLLGPHIEYPKHSHEAEEIYIPMSSQALWVQGNGEWISRPGGIPIYHGSWLPHGMRTGSTPLLALYLWRGGNLAQKSHIE
jgi:Dimethlysulfonioproprionate lyase